MADYNIYVHAIGTGGATSNNPTLPWSARENGQGSSQTESQSGSVPDVLGGFTRAAAYMQNPDALVSTGISRTANYLPFIAAAALVVKISSSVVDNVIDYMEVTGGDYTPGIQRRNVKQGFQNMMTPFSSSVNAFKTELRWNRENSRKQSERALLGDSVINTYTGRGV